MSKILRVTDGDYAVYVQSGGTIRLDTGIEAGEVRITGDLVVEGNTTTVQSENLSITDNIIVINRGEAGAGITLIEAGIRAERGSEPDVKLVFDETVSIIDPDTETTVTGAWSLEDESGNLLGLRTNAIATNGGDLYLINSSTGVVTVTGTNNYENQVTDDDHIPNKKYVDDAITTNISASLQDRIEEGTTTKTYIETLDFEVTGNPSSVRVGVNGAIIAEFFDTRIELNSIRFSETTISSIDSNEDLVLLAPGTGSVRIDDTLHINSVPSIDDATLEPIAPTDGLKLYVADESTGGSGLFFVNSAATRDEMISKSRALLFSMLF